ncbi:MAG: IPT/TIG domain-containing protein [Deltaproteobacteria bacterium]|nr:IPT/TIG domain-containing protein [Deltaproteobacteria bacterium]
MLRLLPRPFGPIAAVLLCATLGCKTDLSLQVTGIEPDRGDIEGGTYVRIKGNGFLNDEKGNTTPANAKVYFGTRQGEVVRFASGSEIIVQAPGGKPNETVDVLIIFEGRGEKKLEKGFTFVEKNTAGPAIEDLDINKKNDKK